MLDKQVVKFTRDGIQKQNLATGESEMLTQSDYSKQIKYNPLESVYNHPSSASPKAAQRSLQHFTDTRINPKGDSHAFPNNNQAVTEAPKVLPGQYAANAENNKQTVGSVSNVQPGRYASSKAGQKHGSSLPTQSVQKNQLYRNPAARKIRTKQLNVLREIKHSAAQEFSESDDLGLQTVGKTYQAAENTNKAIRTVRDYKERVKHRIKPPNASGYRTAARTAERSSRTYAIN